MKALITGIAGDYSSWIQGETEFEDGDTDDMGDVLNLVEQALLAGAAAILIETDLSPDWDK